MFLSKYWAKICMMMPDKMYLQWQFHHIYGHWLSFNTPRTYSDKLAWLKLNGRDKRLSTLVDKYEVRSYVGRKIGNEYLVPLVGGGIYNSADEIPWDTLPEKYVLKCTHDSASVILHRSNEGFDRKAAIKSLNQHLGRNLYWYSREYPYKDVKPRIICEAFLDDKGNPPADYKFFCFDGKAVFVQVDTDRFVGHNKVFVDMNWNELPFYDPDCRHKNMVTEMPKNFDKMTELVENLSNGFPHVRVDFYNLSGKIYFGEMTFFPWGGPIWFRPDEWNYKLGDLIKLDTGK